MQSLKHQMFLMYIFDIGDLLTCNVHLCINGVLIHPSAIWPFGLTLRPAAYEGDDIPEY